MGFTDIYHVLNLFLAVISAELAQKYKVTKYPTMKLFVFGEPMKREYRGQRSADAFKKYLDENLASPITKKNSFEEMDAISVSLKPVTVAAFIHAQTCIIVNVNLTSLVLTF